MIYAGIMALVWPIGAPLGLATILLHRRKKIQAPLDTRDDDSSLDGWRFLFDAYKPESWYWELVVTARRLCAMALVMLSQGGALQLMLGMLLTSAALAAQAHYSPFVENSSNSLAFLTEVQITLAVVVGLVSLLHVDVYEGNEGTMMGVLLVVLTMMVFVLGVLSTLAGAWTSNSRGGLARVMKNLRNSLTRETTRSVVWFAENPVHHNFHESSDRVAAANEVEMGVIPDPRQSAIVDIADVYGDTSKVKVVDNPTRIKPPSQQSAIVDSLGRLG